MYASPRQASKPWPPRFGNKQGLAVTHSEWAVLRCVCAGACRAARRGPETQRGEEPEVGWHVAGIAAQSSIVTPHFVMLLRVLVVLR